MCKTIGGPSSKRYCVFPFTYDKVIYDECAYDKSAGFWCPTSKTFTGDPDIRNTNWGVCGYQCPLTSKENISFLIDAKSLM